MAVKQVIKKLNKIIYKPQVKGLKPKTEEVKIEKNNSKKNKKDMTPKEIENIETMVNDINVPRQTKVLKKDRGLIERTESSKIVLTEDNRLVLND